jgi:hypothetical protein
MSKKARKQNRPRCEQCGTEFDRIRSDQLYCSPACRKLRYEQTPHAVERKRRYDATEPGRARHRRYNLSDAGQERRTTTTDDDDDG